MAINEKDVLDTLLAKYTSKFHTARLNYENYLTGAVGVGEHPDSVGECEGLLLQMQKSQEMIQFLAPGGQAFHLKSQASVAKTSDGLKKENTDDE